MTRRMIVVAGLFLFAAVVLATSPASAPAAGGDQLWLANYPGNVGAPNETLAVSPDGTRLFVTGTTHGAATGQDYGTVAYDAASGAQLWAAQYDFRTDCCGVDRGRVITVSPDGRRVYVSGQSGNAPVITTVAYDAGSGRQLWATRGASGDAFAIALSPDGTRLFVAGESGGTFPDYVALGYDAATGRQLWSASYNGGANRADYAESIGVSADGTRVYVTGTSTEPRPGTIGVTAATTIAYDAATGMQLWRDTFTGPRAATATALAVSPNEGRVFVGGSSTSVGGSTTDGANTIAYDGGSGARLWVAAYPASGASVFAAAASADGTRVYFTGMAPGPSTGEFDFLTLAYGTSTPDLVWAARYAGPGSGSVIGARSIVVSPGGARLYVAGAGATVGYSTASGSQLWASGYTDPVNGGGLALSLGVSPDGTRVFVTGDGSSTYTTVAYDAGLVSVNASRADGFPTARRTLSGGGFAAGETITAHWNGPTGPALGTAVADAAGRFALTFAVPLVPAGKYTIVVVGQTSAATATTPFRVVPALRITPATGSPGSAVTLRGFGYGANEGVTIRWDCEIEPESQCAGPVMGTAHADLSGTFGDFQAVLPNAAGSTVYEIGGKGESTKLYADAEITLSP